MTSKPRKVRHQLFLPADLTEKLKFSASRPGASKSAILSDALAAWLNRRVGHEMDDRFGLRLNRIERNSQIVLESFALFIRYYLNVTPPLADADVAGRAVGRDRFRAFIDQVARQLATGEATLGRTDDAASEPGR